MKHKIKTLITVLFVTLSFTTAFATDNDKDKAGKPKPSREELATTQAQHIAAKLELDENKTARLVTTYVDCQKEIWALGRPEDGKKKSTTDAEAEASIKARFEQSQKMLDIRRKYYDQYRKFLTPLQIEKLYRLEKKMMDKLFKNKKERTGHKQKPRKPRKPRQPRH